MTELLSQAQADRRGIAAMNVIQLEHAEAIVTGAELAGCPAVLQVSENTAAYHGSLAPIALACLRIAEDSTAAVCVHLDHAKRADLVAEAVELGIRSVMFDASSLSYTDNVTATHEVVTWCHERGTAVEGELGEIGGKNGVHEFGVRTEPAEAAEYVARTGVDALAVAVGSSHALRTRHTQLDNDLIATLKSALPVPLVLHGSSGVPDSGLVAAVAAGMTKFNIATHLNAVLTQSVRAALKSDVKLVDPRKYFGAGRDAVSAEVARLLALLAG